MVKHALIIGAAPETDKTYIPRLLAEMPGAFIICADGGARVAEELHITPHLIIGDSDSLLPADGLFENVERIRLPIEKDDTDLKVCADEAIRRGAERIALACVSGGRLDHYLANLHLLEYIHSMGAMGFVYDRQNIAWYHEGQPLSLPVLRDFRFFSILPVDDMLRDVVMEDFKFPLAGVLVSRATPLTVSNEITGKHPRISFTGRAFLIFSKDCAL